MADLAGGPDRYEDVPLSALLRAALRTYSEAVDATARREGFDDLPGAGVLIVSTMSWADASLESVIRWMGVSKQSVGATVDSLVVRGYLERARDPRDRRRVVLTLTPKGRAAGRAARSAVRGVDARLRSRIGERPIRQARRTLVELLRIRSKPLRSRGHR